MRISVSRGSRTPFLKHPSSRFAIPEYAQVLKMLGNGRLEAQCFDGEKRLAHIRGKLRKKVCYSSLASSAEAIRPLIT